MTWRAGAEAQLFVPRALAMLGASEAARAEWGTHWREAPLNALLPWAAQMLSLLDAPEGAPLLPTLQVPCAAAGMHACLHARS